jgi:catechol-2,3-dioxygenase
MKIKSLTLFTRNLAQQREFYTQVLGLQLLNSEQEKVCFSVGDSVLEFKKHRNSLPYHFAINIPSYSEEQALEWIRQKAEILTDEGREIQYFTNWNARSVYFYDPDRNIVEFISRRNLGYPFRAPFGPDCLCEISEIGMATTDIKPLYDWLSEKLGLAIYDGSPERFCAIGDELGLFICVNLESKTWYPTGDRACPASFEAILGIGDKEYEVSYQEQNLQLHTDLA